MEFSLLKRMSNSMNNLVNLEQNLAFYLKIYLELTKLSSDFFKLELTHQFSAPLNGHLLN